MARQMIKTEEGLIIREIDELGNVMSETFIQRKAPLFKFNDNHDENGRFASGDGGSAEGSKLSHTVSRSVLPQYEFSGGEGNPVATVKEVFRPEGAKESIELFYPENTDDFFMDIDGLKNELDALPKDAKSALPKTMELSPFGDPELASIKEAYGETAVTMATANYHTGKLTVYNGNDLNVMTVGDIPYTLRHEIGHFVDQKVGYLSRTEAYIQAFHDDSEEAKIFAGNVEFGGYATDYAKEYGDAVIGNQKFGEDFAEVFAMTTQAIADKSVAEYGFQNRSNLIKERLREAVNKK